MQAHVDIEHKSKEKQIKANALLGFEYNEKDHNKEKTNPKFAKAKKFEIKDQEGVDFNFYFSEKYNFVHDKRHAHQSVYQRGNKYQGRGGHQGGH